MWGRVARWAQLWAMCLLFFGRAHVQAAQVLSDADLARLQAGLASQQSGVRLAAAQTIAGADADDEDGESRYAAWLRKDLESPQALLQKLIHAIHGQYPNPDYPRGPGKDPPMWFLRPEPAVSSGTRKKDRPKPHDPEAVDWLTAFAALDVAQDPFLSGLPTAPLHKARTELLFKVALLRALARAGHKGSRQAVQPVFDQAFVRDGILRDECGRQIRAMGSPAIPGLLRAFYNRARSNAKMRRYASYQLDRMDRLRPSKAIVSASDDTVRADIIHTYGEVLAIDAVDAVLEQVSARSRRVRREARWALLRYVDGPPPPPPPKRKRKLPGGKEEVEEKEDYLSYRDLALLKLRQTHTTELGLSPATSVSPRQMAVELFAHYDRQEEAQFSKLFAAANKHFTDGQVELAVSEFGWILANQPDHPRRADMAAAFRHYGESLAVRALSHNDDLLRAQAVGWLRQSALLSPRQPGQDQLWARIHLLDGQLALRHGGDGRVDFAAVLRYDPLNVEARARSVSLKPQPRRHPLRVGVLALFSLGLILLGVVFRLRPKSA